MAITLNDLINDYGSYSGNTLVGERGARANIPNAGFGGVSGVPYDNITFIVEIDGKKYASSKWLATQKNTPYQDQNNVAGAGLSIRTASATRIDSDNQGQTLQDQERYAEVTVSKNLKSADDILKHINWLVSDGDALRSVSDYGSWQWDYDTTPSREATIITSPLGTEFTVGVTYTGFTSPIAGGFVGKYNADSDYRGIDPGLRFKATGWDGTVAGEAALTQEPKTTSETVEVVTETETEVSTEVPTNETVEIKSTNTTPFTGGAGGSGGSSSGGNLFDTSSFFDPNTSSLTFGNDFTFGTGGTFGSFGYFN